MQRRGLLLGLLAAPAIIRTPGLLMPVKKVPVVPPPPPILRGLRLEYGMRFEVVNTSPELLFVYSPDGVFVTKLGQGGKYKFHEFYQSDAA